MTTTFQSDMPADTLIAETSRQARREADAFRDYLKKLPEKGWLNPSFCTDWTIKEVAEHQAAQGALMLDMVRASMAGRPMPELTPDTIAAYESRLDGLNRLELADRLSQVTHEFYDLLEHATPEQLTRTSQTRFGEVTLETVGSFRLSELSLHSWDVRVVNDLSAKVSRESLPLLFPGLVASLPGLANQQTARELSGLTYQFEVTGSAKGPVALSLANNRVASRSGYAAKADVLIKLDSEAFLRMAWGRLKLDWMIKNGWIKVEGDEQNAYKLTQLFQGV